MVTGSIAVLTFGFVVAVAAGSLPGSREDSRLEVAFRADFDPTPVLAWVLLLLALVGVMLFAMGMKQARPRKERGKRGVLIILLGVVVFVLLLNWVRPMADAWLEETPPTAGTATDIAGSGADPGDNAGEVAWLFGVLVAAVVAACLTAIGLKVTAAEPAAQPGAQPAGEHDEGPPPPTSSSRPIASSSGDDPRSRILTAYEQFETTLALAGHRRVETETTRRHAGRVATRLGLDRGQVDDLVELHAVARYGSAEPGSAEAGSAESLSAALRDRIPG
jgi:hypothetical protein